MSNEVNMGIYSMIRVSKFYDRKPILKDIADKLMLIRLPFSDGII